MIVITILSGCKVANRRARAEQGQQVQWKNNTNVDVTIRFAGRSPFRRKTIFVPKNKGSSKPETVRKDPNQRREEFYEYTLSCATKGPHLGPGIVVPPPPPPPKSGKFTSDFIIGKQGDSLRGKVLTKQFTVSTVFGRITLKTKDIAYIHFDRPKKGVDDIWLHNGDRLTGKIQNKTIDFKPDGAAARKIPTSVIHTVIIGFDFDGRVKAL